ncbi:MAG: hypothetical protein WCJ35_28845, partial [Planctomycetota bacterium]
RVAAYATSNDDGSIAKCFCDSILLLILFLITKCASGNRLLVGFCYSPGLLLRSAKGLQRPYRFSTIMGS